MVLSGFGDVGVNTSFWFGLEPLYQLTSNGGYTRMRVEIYANDSAWYSAEYDHFLVHNESTGYQLSISGYSGDAGNHLELNNGETFSSFDHGTHSSLALTTQGGWWYSDWFNFANLNGAYQFTIMSPSTGFYWNCSFCYQPPPTMASLVDIRPGRLLMSRIMITRP